MKLVAAGWGYSAILGETLVDYSFQLKEKPHKLGFPTFRMVYQEYETDLYLLITKFVNV